MIWIWLKINSRISRNLRDFSCKVFPYVFQEKIQRIKMFWKFQKKKFRKLFSTRRTNDQLPHNISFFLHMNKLLTAWTSKEKTIKYGLSFLLKSFLFIQTSERSIRCQKLIDQRRYVFTFEKFVWKKCAVVYFLRILKILWTNQKFSSFSFSKIQINCVLYQIKLNKANKLQINQIKWIRYNNQMKQYI